MIEENKLRELIKDNKKFYSLILPNEYGVPQIKEENALDFATFFIYCINNINIFETKEEANWFLEFGDITREERLSFPTWEDFKENCNFPTIHCKNGKTANFTVSNSYLEIYEDSDDGYCEKKIYGKPLTKENYIDACRLCKKLFLGEK